MSAVKLLLVVDNEMSVRYVYLMDYITRCVLLVSLRYCCRFSVQCIFVFLLHLFAVLYLLHFFTYLCYTSYLIFCCVYVCARACVIFAYKHMF